VEVPKPELLSTTLVNVVAQATVADAELRVALKTWIPRLLHTAFSAGSGGVTSFRALYVLQTILRTHAGSLGGPATTVWISRLGFPAPVKLWVLSQVAIACPENALGLMFDTSSLTDPFLADPHDYCTLLRLLARGIWYDSEESMRFYPLPAAALRDILRKKPFEDATDEANLHASLYRFAVQGAPTKYMPTILQAIGGARKEVASSMLLQIWQRHVKDVAVQAKWAEVASTMPKEFAIFEEFAKQKRVKISGEAAEIAMTALEKRGVKVKRSSKCGFLLKVLLGAVIFVGISVGVARFDAG